MTSNILRQLSKIAAHDPLIIENLSLSLSKIIDKNPIVLENLCESISDGQLLSKWWLADILKNIKLGTMFLCCGWYGILLLDKRLNYEKCVSIDIDPTCEEIARTINRNLVIDNWKFQAVTEDIKKINYDKNIFRITRSNNTICETSISPDTIINLSCEHIENFNSWWELLPKNKLIILQSNNGFNIKGHVNCVKNLKEFSKQTPMKKVIFSGEKEMPKFTRYMRVGYK